MGGMKRHLEEVADELGIDNILDPVVVAEAQRRLDNLPSCDEYCSRDECSEHLADCDEDGYCNRCGEQ
jgi:hypothetical protein